MQHCVDNEEALTKRLKANIADLNAGKAFGREQVFVPIKFHLVADNEGLGRIEIHEVFEELCLINEEFEDAGMTFYIQDGFNMINNSSIYESPATGVGIARMITERREKGEAALNIFITQNAQRGEVENGTVLGFYSIENDWVVVRKNQIGRNNNTLVHEIGHFFSLKHPHAGWDNEPWTQEDHGNPVLITRVNGIQIELVDGSNCETAGDLICDTPPDYNFGFSWDSNCPVFDLDVLDRNLDTLKPQQNNHMSYFLGCMPYTFSPRQNMVMMADYNSSLKSYLRTGYIPEDNEINTNINVLSPGNNTTTEFYNGIELRWNKVENATDYAISFSSGNEQIDFIIQDTAFYMTDLSPNRTTNDMTTATKDPAFIQDIVIFPNPTIAGASTQLKFSSTESLSAELYISDLNGRRIFAMKEKLQVGENTLNLALHNYNEGLYILSLHTETGTLTRKILIN